MTHVHPVQSIFLSEASRLTNAMRLGTNRQQSAWRAIQTLPALDLLGPWRLAGTIPLNIETPDSDLDIICCVADLDQWSELVAQHFSALREFRIKRTEIGGRPTGVARFIFDNFKWEIFAQTQHLHEQRAIVHLVVEDWLLQLGGALARDSIRTLKTAGLATEPAFAAWFGIPGDPWDALADVAHRMARDQFWMPLWAPFNDHVSHADLSSSRAGTLEILDAMPDFIAAQLQGLTDLNLKDLAPTIDHACWRTSTVERWEMHKSNLKEKAWLLSEAFINGRPIATYKLKSPVRIKSSSGVPAVVDVLELPAPKPAHQSSQMNGFDHIEAVIDCPLEVFLSQAKQRSPHIAWDLGNFRANRNRDIALSTPSGIIKFHELPLEQVIAQEKVAILRELSPRPVAIFDFDDTLVASRQPFLKAVHRALEIYVGQSLSRTEVEAKAQPTFPDFFAAFGIHDPTKIKAVIDLFAETWESHVHECTVPAGIPSILSCLNFEGVRCVVWTARDERTTRSTLDVLGLGNHVADVIGYGVDGGKPHPAARILELTRQTRCVLIGDSISDQRGAAAIGATFLQATWIHSANLGQSITHSTPFSALAAAMKILRPSS
jgi:phosphoglycolate phosphatase-like HAD superfamily hydrolase/predicted metalloenzyme YecM